MNPFDKFDQKKPKSGSRYDALLKAQPAKPHKYDALLAAAKAGKGDVQDPDDQDGDAFSSTLDA